MNHVLDANCWAMYVSETLKSEPSHGHAAFKKATENGKISLDNGNHIQQQYIACRPGQEDLFLAIFGEFITSGRVSFVDLSGKNNMLKELSGLGIPKSEHIYFRTAIHGKAEYIISDDVDFFDPTIKKSPSIKHIECKSRSSGPVCKYMKKGYGINIVWVQIF